MKKRIKNLVRIFKKPYRFIYGKTGIYVCHSKIGSQVYTPIPYNPNDYEARSRSGAEVVWFFSVYEN
jgi:hypothetical protein